jgi:hypothetical protein
MAGIGRFESEVVKRAALTTFTAVVARLDRAIQYSRALEMEPQRRGVLDRPVIGERKRRRLSNGYAGR